MPNEPARLSAPLIRVLLEGREDVVEVQTRNPDLVLWDRTRAKHHWPKFDEAPFLWLTFLSWAACRRLGETDLTYEKFEAATLSVDPVEDEDNVFESEVGAPFPPGVTRPPDL